MLASSKVSTELHLKTETGDESSVDEKIFRLVSLQFRFFSNLSVPFRKSCGLFSKPTWRLFQLIFFLKNIIGDFSKSNTTYDFSFMFTTCYLPKEIKTSTEYLFVYQQINSYLLETKALLIDIEKQHRTNSKLYIKLKNIEDILISLNNFLSIICS
ncbi:MAG: hypothetical protein HC815_05965 [Richelia sp. RM1_1_1]|nr:hypothetical protein [Richelia sp. RM1_1_1]